MNMKEESGRALVMQFIESIGNPEDKLQEINVVLDRLQRVIAVFNSLIERSERLIKKSQGFGELLERRASLAQAHLESYKDHKVSDRDTPDKMELALQVSLASTTRLLKENSDIRTNSETRLSRFQTTKRDLEAFRNDLMPLKKALEPSCLIM
jgi:hypothetical protein